MYTQLIGPLGPDALFGSCGLLDDAFDVMIGPDPVKDCEARTGPLPNPATPSAPSSSSSGTPKGANARSGAAAPTGSAAPAGSQPDPLTTLYGPLTGAGG
jgi:hypothetical protein